MPAASQMPESVEIQKHLSSIHIDEWKKYDFLHARWWILIGLLLIAILIWWILLDKSRIKEVCLYAFLALIVMLTLREYGEELILWDYPTDVIPIFPPLSSINLLILPLSYSLIYQYYGTKRRFIWAALFITAIKCFIIEPIFVWGNLYELLNWQHYYNFPLFFAAALFIRYLTIKIYKIENKSVIRR